MNSERLLPSDRALNASHEQLAADRGVIEVRLRELNQLFETLDPSPFRERDLDRHAEEYIVESVKEFRSRTPYALVVYLDQSMGLPDDRRAVGDAIRVHFGRRSRILRRELRRLMRRGFVSLGIGLAFLATFFTISQLVGRFMAESALATLLQEGLLIVGWVAMWRPLEIFLYDWWPIVGERRIYDRLSRINVRVVFGGAGQKNEPREVRVATEDAAALARWEGEGGRAATAERRPRR